MNSAKTQPLNDFDMMMIRAGAPVQDSAPVRRNIAQRKYLVRRKLCRGLAATLASIANWLESRDAVYARRATSIS